MQDSITQWDFVYAELTNKIRWAISSTASQIPLTIPFRDVMSVAGQFAGDVLPILKLMEEKPNYQFQLTTKNANQNGKTASIPSKT